MVHARYPHGAIHQEGNLTKQIMIDRRNPALWIATIYNPPINLINIDTILELQALVAELETDPHLRVIVFRSADPDFFFAHWDVLTDNKKAAAMPNGPTGMYPWIDILARLSRAPVVSIAEIRGRARGSGSEFVLACDMRFASPENAVLGPFEVGVGAAPGGNPMARLAGLLGRGRALEVVIGADDFPGALAERYGYVNRALPDAELEGFVDVFSKRIAGFEKHAIIGAKALLDEVSLPPDTVFPPALKKFFISVEHPGTRARVAAILQRGLQKRSDIEMSLGDAVAE
jgi:enoyl-CoA hydratase/carnithine racemase